MRLDKEPENGSLLGRAPADPKWSILQNDVTSASVGGYYTNSQDTPLSFTTPVAVPGVLECILYIVYQLLGGKWDIRFWILDCGLGSGERETRGIRCVYT